MASFIVSRDTKLGELTNVSPKWFEQLIAVRLRRPVNNADTARENISALMREQAAIQNNTFDWSKEVQHRRQGATVDRSTWEPSLGTENDSGVAGIAKTDSSTNGDGSHYIVVHKVPNEESLNLHVFFNSNPEMTVGEFVNSVPYKVTRDHARRNARRIATRIAASLDCDVPVSKLIATEEDAQTAPSQSNLRPEQLAVPDYWVEFNCFDDVGLLSTTQNAQKKAVLYRGPHANVQHAPTVLKMGDPCSGMILRKCSAAEQLEPVNVPIVHSSQEENIDYIRKKRGDKRNDEERGANNPWRKHVQQTYVTRDGNKPSSASRALWQTSSGEKLQDGDIRLMPVVFVIHGKTALH